MNDFLLRPGRVEDLAALARIEIEAAALFPANVLHSAHRATLPPEQLHAAIRHSLLWVAELSEGEVIGFVVASECGRSLPIDEMDVTPVQARKGVGTELLKRILQVASERGHQHVTLTTFAQIPWNAPFYRKHGFVQVQNLKHLPYLARALHVEHVRGLKRRVAMVANAA